MAGWTPLVSVVGSRLAGRFASRSLRFRSAVVAGFALTTIGTASVGTGTTGFADDFFSVLNNLFQVQPSAPQYQQPSADRRNRASRSASLHRASTRLARRRRDETKPELRLASVRQEKPVRLGRESVCVRLCDGFTFPVGTYHGEEDRASHEATCQSECPGAQTALYVLPNGSDQIGDAVDAKSGHAYSQIPAAFRYTTFIEAACSCHPQEGNRISSLLRDFTLRRGDAIMTKTGFKVFHGGSHFPYSPSDFIALAKSHDIHSSRRATFHAIERASVPAKANLAQGQVPAHTAAGQSSAGLERQASLAP